MNRSHIRLLSVLGVFSTLFALASAVSAATYADLYNFAGVPQDDGKNPDGSLIQVGSSLYGVAKGGNGVGVIFSFNPRSRFKT